MFPQSADLRAVDRRWHEFAQMAKESTFSLDDWDEISIQRYDLDDRHRTPTGQENPRTWLYESPLVPVVRPTGDRLVDAREQIRGDRKSVV